MRDVFVIHLRHGSEKQVTFKRDHEAAGYTMRGERISCLPDARGVTVANVIHDIDSDVTYTLLDGVLYDNAELFVEDCRWLRDHDWVEDVE